MRLKQQFGEIQQRSLHEKVILHAERAGGLLAIIFCLFERAETILASPDSEILVKIP